jgi:hypothetical protein
VRWNLILSESELEALTRLKAKTALLAISYGLHGLDGTISSASYT